MGHILMLISTQALPEKPSLGDNHREMHIHPTEELALKTSCPFLQNMVYVICCSPRSDAGGCHKH